MKNFLNKLNTVLHRIFYGRYGFDELSRTTTFLALLLLVLSWFPKLHFLYLPTPFLWIWIIFRCYSRNTVKRLAERDAYLRLKGKVKRWCSLFKRMFHDRKTHRYFRCSQCKTFIRVKKGKGKVSITCPKCNNELIKKT